jgi:hypothetical protein
MFNLIDIYIFIPVSGCVDIDPCAVLCPGAYNAVKKALLTPSVECLYHFLAYTINIMLCYHSYNFLFKTKYLL